VVADERREERRTTAAGQPRGQVFHCQGRAITEISAKRTIDVNIDDARYEDAGMDFATVNIGREALNRNDPSSFQKHPSSGENFVRSHHPFCLDMGPCVDTTHCL